MIYADIATAKGGAADGGRGELCNASGGRRRLEARGRRRMEAVGSSSYSSKKSCVETA
jgi:hypothetical protein